MLFPEKLRSVAGIVIRLMIRAAPVTAVLLWLVAHHWLILLNAPVTSRFYGITIHRQGYVLTFGSPPRRGQLLHAVETNPNNSADWHLLLEDYEPRWYTQFFVHCDTTVGVSNPRPFQVWGIHHFPVVMFLALLFALDHVRRKRSGRRLNAESHSLNQT